MKCLVLIAALATVLAACNGSDDKESAAVADPLSDLSVTAAEALDLPPTDGKLPTELLPPQ